MSLTLRDFRYACRTLRMAPAFALAAIGSIAVGIGGNVTIFSLVNGLLLRPLPYPEADRLVSIRTVLPTGVDLGVLGIHILRWREEVTSIEAIEGVYTAIRNTRNLEAPGDPESVGAVRITAGLFEMLGSQAATRTLVPANGRGARSARRGDSQRLPVAAPFSADPHIIGSPSLARWGIVYGCWRHTSGLALLSKTPVGPAAIDARPHRRVHSDSAENRGVGRKRAQPGIYGHCPAEAGHIAPAGP